MFIVRGILQPVGFIRQEWLRLAHQRCLREELLNDPRTEPHPPLRDLQPFECARPGGEHVAVVEVASDRGLMVCSPPDLEHPDSTQDCNVCDPQPHLFLQRQPRLIGLVVRHVHQRRMAPQEAGVCNRGPPQGVPEPRTLAFQLVDELCSKQVRHSRGPIVGPWKDTHSVHHHAPPSLPCMPRPEGRELDGERVTQPLAVAPVHNADRDAGLEGPRQSLDCKGVPLAPVRRVRGAHSHLGHSIGIHLETQPAGEDRGG
mmetsp:Transcript_136690/g.237331  ORF Transcript_136690/g.237331 Transcript_136690/m.237331 type:complete len:258 (+) Transcript_136690:314-1087(+)